MNPPKYKHTYSIAAMASLSITFVIIFAFIQPILTNKKIIATDNADLATDKNMDVDAARRSAEKFLGRGMSDNEWTYLLRATSAEASNDTKEQGYVMAVILNRVRSGNWGPSVISVVTAHNQFQSVTGTRYNEHHPNGMFTQGPSGGRLGSILNAARTVLPSAPTDIKRFTAANPAAYGPGTNIKYMHQLAQDGQKIGQTYFAV